MSQCTLLAPQHSSAPPGEEVRELEARWAPDGCMAKWDELNTAPDHKIPHVKWGAIRTLLPSLMHDGRKVGQCRASAIHTQGLDPNPAHTTRFLLCDHTPPVSVLHSHLATQSRTPNAGELVPPRGVPQHDIIMMPSAAGLVPHGDAQREAASRDP